MLITIGGNARLASNGVTIDSPSFTLSCTCEMARAMTVLPAVSRVMLSACRIGTPLVTSVPSVRENREMAVFRIKSPQYDATLPSRSWPDFAAYRHRDRGRRPDGR